MTPFFLYIFGLLVFWCTSDQPLNHKLSYQVLFPLTLWIQRRTENRDNAHFDTLGLLFLLRNYDQQNKQRLSELNLCRSPVFVLRKPYTEPSIGVSYKISINTTK